jgi:hypothetical protein
VLKEQGSELITGYTVSAQFDSSWFGVRQKFMIFVNAIEHFIDIRSSWPFSTESFFLCPKL